MDLVGVYAALGQDRCTRLVRTISIGALRTYGVYQAIKIRSRLHTFNRQKLRAASQKLWRRILDGDADLARDLSQGVLVSNIPLVVAVLDFLEIQHDDNGFFAKDDDYSQQFAAGWPEAVFEEFSGRFSEDLVLLYINHLGWETGALDIPYMGPDDGRLAAASE